MKRSIEDSIKEWSHTTGMRFRFIFYSDKKNTIHSGWHDTADSALDDLNTTYNATTVENTEQAL